MRVKRVGKTWWIFGHWPAVGPYHRRDEAKEALTGLIRFYGQKTLSRSQFSQGDFVMQVKRSALVRLLVAVGVETAPKWDLARLKKKATRGLMEMNDPDDPLVNEIESKEDKDLLIALLAAAGNKEDVEIEDDGDGQAEAAAKPAEKPAKPAKKPKADKPAPAEKPAKPAKKPKAEGAAANGEGVDQFGFRKGSKASRIAGVITKTPKSMQELMAEAGLDKQQYGYVGKLVERGLVVKTDNKYALA